jgi:exodeoxyribonuclease V beta subunit
MAAPLDLTTHVLTNGHTIEASAGTGKTYSVAALVTRAIATDDDLRIDRILITTFTRGAAAELRDRVRRRLADTATKLHADEEDPDDSILTALRADVSQRQQYVRNLRRAVVNFDNATISTIHSVCSKILALAGQTTHDEAAEEFAKRVIAEVVNDRLVSEAVAHGRTWDEGRVAKLVKARLDSPLAEQWFDPNLDAATVSQLDLLRSMLDDLVDEVSRRTLNHPSFSDLIRRAEQVLAGEQGDEIRARFAERYTHAFVDEAQDTDALQWRLFHHVFPKHDPSSTHKLTAVGDPKQAIYAFRGADVNAYLQVRDPDNMSTLDTNYRSDEPVIDALNALFEGRSLGHGISYTNVNADPKKASSKVRGVGPVEAIDLGAANEQFEVALAGVGHVVRLLQSGEILDNDTWRPIEPKDICVLTGSNTLVRSIQARLQRHGIPAVASGAESVFSDPTAIDLQVLFEALERIGHAGRIRKVATTSFFGFGLGDPRLLPAAAGGEADVVLALQSKLVGWRQVLLRRGIAALAAEITSDIDVMNVFVAGLSGERKLADFSHIVELLHSATGGKGVSPEEVLQIFAEYATIDRNSEIVSRRVESDADAVQVMTIHKSKGLEFPCVVVADLWKYKTYERDQLPMYNLPHDAESTGTRIDISWAIGDIADESKQRINTAQGEEQQRLLYVAMTRAENHLAFLWPSTPPRPSVLGDTLNVDVIGTPNDNGEIRVRTLQRNQVPKNWRHTPPDDEEPAEFRLAVGPSAVEQTYRRTSFTGITRAQKSISRKVGAPEFDPAAGGADEYDNWFVTKSRYADPATPTGVHMPLARLVGGTYVGKVLHEVYENIDTSAANLRDEVEAQCRRIITGSLLRNDIDAIIDGIHLSLITPLGAHLDSTTLANIEPERRLAELNFEMSVADLANGVRVSDFGRILDDLVPGDDTLRPYVEMLKHESFDIALAGLVNGSIDAVLQLGTDDNPRLWITDYKSNRLDQEGDETLIAAYSQERLFESMVHHHYPLQALLYGTAMYRYLRWRAPHLANPSDHVKGFSYFFIRGMVGPSTPPDTGVFAWQAPSSLWQRLSDRLAGDAL